MGRASWLGLCPNSPHKVEVWACALGLRSVPVYILFSTPSRTLLKKKKLEIRTLYQDERKNEIRKINRMTKTKEQIAR